MTSPLEPSDLAALSIAQDIMYDAWDAPTLAKARALARRALKISPLCADAISFLAQDAEPGSAEKIRLLASAVTSARLVLGTEKFNAAKGQFWRVFETRPYMRAREALARAKWEAGLRAEAMAELRALLRLCPGDNQGNRYTLTAWLAATGDDEALAKHLKRHARDCSPIIAWTAVLSSFRLEGGRDEYRARLARAMGTNPHVAAYLTGAKMPPKRVPDFCAIGSEDEAIHYAQEFLVLWRATPGAIERLYGELTLDRKGSMLH